jgi:hypothetical protein
LQIGQGIITLLLVCSTVFSFCMMVVAHIEDSGQKLSWMTDGGDRTLGMDGDEADNMIYAPSGFFFSGGNQGGG